MDFDSLSRELLARSESVVAEWLPAGKRHGREYRVGNLHGEAGESLSINLETGVWRDFASGEGGADLISLYAAINRVGQGDAYKHLTNGKAPVALRQPVAEPQIIVPVPDDAPEPTLHHRRYGMPSASWRYLDADGNLIGVVARYDPDDGRKQIIPWVWTDLGWSPKAFTKPRPLYGLRELAQNPARPVMVVEGEKSADAARTMLAGWVVVTWPGGAQSIRHVDWQPLHGRRVTIWPDADEPGRAAAESIAEILHPHADEIRLLDVSDYTDGWDAADAAADVRVRASITAWAKPRVRPYGPRQAPPAPPAPPKPPAASGGGAGGPDYHSPLPFLGTTGRPISCIDNLREVVDRLGVTVRYNVISKEEEILIPDGRFSIDNRQNASLAWLISEAAKFRLPQDRIPDYVTYLADANQYNPVTEWITSKPWDGRDRLSELLSTVTCTAESERLKRPLITRWMISAVAAAFRPTGVSAHGVLVMQGEQYVGKTLWFKRLVPAELGVLKDGLSLKPDDRDSVMRCVRNWLVELGEVDATFRKADVAALKSFLTSDRDVLRRAYGRRESEFARRTVFFASVNPKFYLHDSTGNRRYWTLEVTHLDLEHAIDMQQCWAQVYEQLYQAGESWFLTQSEFAMLTSHNEEYTVIDPVEDLIVNRLAWNDPKLSWKWRSATEVLIDCGMTRPSKSDVTQAGIMIRRLNGDQSKRTASSRLLLVPDTLVSSSGGGVSGPSY